MNECVPWCLLILQDHAAHSSPFPFCLSPLWVPADQKSQMKASTQDHQNQCSSSSSSSTSTINPAL